MAVSDDDKRDDSTSANDQEEASREAASRPDDGSAEAEAAAASEQASDEPEDVRSSEAPAKPQQSEEAAGPPPHSPAEAGGSGRGAPTWVVPLYVGGLVLLYIGERILSTYETTRWIVSGLGLSSVLAATAIRFMPTHQAGGERGRIDRLLGILSVVGIGGLVLYLFGTDWGLEKLRLGDADDATREEVHNLLTVAWVSLITISVVPMLFAEAALYPMRNAERLESRRVRAAAASGFVLSLAALYGALFVYSADGADLDVDFSYFKTSEPSDSTRRLVEGLGQPIEVYAFFPQVSPVRSEVEGYLNKLAEGASNMKVEVHDRYLVPKLATDLKVVRDGTILIKKGEAKRTLHLGTEMSDARANLKTLDRDFQQRLYKLLRSRRTIYMTVGHGELNDRPRGATPDPERSARLLEKLLEKQHYVVKNLGLSHGLANDVPDDADIVMVLGPSQPFAPEEIDSLTRYAHRGGKLFIALDPEAIPTRGLPSVDGAGVELASAPVDDDTGAPAGDEAPAPSAAPGAGEASPTPSTEDAEVGATLASLERLAGIVGVQFSPVLLANDKRHVRRRFNDSDRTLLITNRFSSHASVSTLSRNASRVAVLVAGAGHLGRAPGTTAKVDMALRAEASTFDDENRNYEFDEGSEKRDSYGLAVAVTQAAEGGEAKPAATQDDSSDDKDIEDVPLPNEMRAFVLADVDALSDVVMANFMTNQLLVVDAVRWLGGEESYAGEVNVEEDVRIEHTQQKDLVVFYSTIFGAPALVLGIGLVVARQSRRPRGRGGKKG